MTEFFAEADKKNLRAFTDPFSVKKYIYLTTGENR